MGNELKNKILEYNGISIDNAIKQRPAISDCPRCNFINALENKYCSSCSYPLSSQAFDEIKQKEEIRIKKLEEKYETDMNVFQEKVENRIRELFQKIDIQMLK